MVIKSIKSNHVLFTCRETRVPQINARMNMKDVRFAKETTN